MAKLDGKVAIITGAAAGLGKGIATVYAKYGAKMCLIDIDKEVVNTAKQLQEKFQTEIISYVGSVANKEQMQEAAKITIEKFGKINIACCNAGVCRLAPFEQMSDEIRDFHIDVNIKGVWNTCQAVIPYMLKNGGGSIVIASSVTGDIVADAGEAAYAMTKSALVGLTKSLAVEYASRNIRVNCSQLGYARTPMVEKMAIESNPDDPESAINDIAKGVPMNRLAKPTEVGELFAFLGINGAGKSTTINILCGQLSKDCGRIVIDGDDINLHADKIKNKLGVVFQQSVLDSSLTVYDNLECRAALYGILGKDFKHRLEYLAKLLDFGSLLKRTVGKLSGGQRRRIDIARALLHEPKILILDEPTTGLDPQTRKTLWQVISTLRQEQDMTVFLTTHYMEEAADADYVVIIDAGKIAAEGTPLQLKNTYTGDFITLYGVQEEQVRPLGLAYEQIRDAFRISVPNTAKATELITRYPDVFFDYEVTKGKMDEVFLAVTGKELLGGISRENSSDID